MTAYPEKLSVAPFTRPVSGPVAIPGSKSITNRALMLAALCRQPTLLRGALFSDDTRFMAEALRQLGFTVTADEAAHTLRVGGQQSAFQVEKAELFVGLAGTAARFLTALCAAASRGVYRIDGVPQMRKRPMQPLIVALRELGADIRCTGEEGFFPLEIHARGLRGGAVALDATESSQLLSALLMVAPLAATPVSIHLSHHVRWPFVEMTIHQMAAFGCAIPPFAQALKIIPVPRGAYAGPAGAEFAIEPDATAASYFLALPYVAGGTVRINDLAAPGVGLQGDTEFLNVLARVGGSIELKDGRVAVSFERGARRVGVTQDFSEFSDTFLTLAAIAPLLDGPTRITGIAHTRKQETDRVAGMARELLKLGQEVVEEHDALTITPRPLKAGVEIETYGDHRFAMSFGLLGCHDLHANGQPWLTIKNPACCAKTFPNFFELLATLRENSLKS